MAEAVNYLAEVVGAGVVVSRVTVGRIHFRNDLTAPRY